MFKFKGHYILMCLHSVHLSWPVTHGDSRNIFGQTNYFKINCFGMIFNESQKIMIENKIVNNIVLRIEYILQLRTKWFNNFFNSVNRTIDLFFILIQTNYSMLSKVLRGRSTVPEKSFGEIRNTQTDFSLEFK